MFTLIVLSTLSAADLPHADAQLCWRCDAVTRSSRVALGAATENIHTDPYAQMTDQELAAELERLGIEPTVQ